MYWKNETSQQAEDTKKKSQRTTIHPTNGNSQCIRPNHHHHTITPYHLATLRPQTSQRTTPQTTSTAKALKQPYLSSHTPSEEYAKMAMLGFAALTATFLAGASATNLPTYYSSVTAGQL